jgi:hypothetical protein
MGQGLRVEGAICLTQIVTEGKALPQK